MMKGFYIGLLTVLGLSLLTGCADSQVENEVKQVTKTEGEKVSDPLYVSTNEDYKVPFKIKDIKSVYVNLNDSASGPDLSGVRYEVSLLSETEIPNEDRTSFNFEIVTDSLLKESLGPIHSIHLTGAGDGYLYTLSFETIYRDYSEEELEGLDN